VDVRGVNEFEHRFCLCVRVDPCGRRLAAKAVYTFCGE
jgi:hypothetical protein